MIFLILGSTFKNYVYVILLLLLTFRASVLSTLANYWYVHYYTRTCNQRIVWSVVVVIVVIIILAVVVAYIVVVSVFFIHHPCCRHRRHHHAGWCKMMTAMTTTT